MQDPHKIEAIYQSIIEELPGMIHENVIEINLELLCALNLLDPNNSILARGHDFSFHVYEGDEKITLMNDRFFIWIIPQLIDCQPVTYAIVALNKDPIENIELVFSAQGAYNSSKIILRVLSHYLKDIVENESMLDRFTQEL